MCTSDVHSRPVRTIAIVLAAGFSSRCPLANKLLLPLEQSSIIGTVLETLGKSKVSEILVVLGHEAEMVRENISDQGICTVVNADYQAGIGGSISTGVTKAGPDWDGYVICLGDMPFFKTSTINALIDKFSAQEDAATCIVRPYFRGHEGHPVLLGASFRSDLEHLKGDIGARNILNENTDRVRHVEVFDTGVFADLDTMEDYKRLVGPLPPRKP